MNNYSVHWRDTTTNNQKHNFLLPSPCCRVLLIGMSGSGKTSLLLRLLLQRSWLDYNNLFVCGKSLHQSEYKLLKAGFDKGYTKREILELFERGQGNVDQYIENLSSKRAAATVNVFYFDNVKSIPDPNEVDNRNKNIFVFDDIMTDNNQSRVEDFYTRGRHNNVSSIYISQNYHKLPRQTIRSNANILVLFAQPQKDLRHIYEDVVSKDMSWVEFNEFVSNIWTHPFAYIVINKNMPSAEGRYQANFNCVYIPKKFI